jgi:hypothetical protein
MTGLLSTLIIRENFVNSKIILFTFLHLTLIIFLQVQNRCFDDSGGWYDHVMPPIINDSQTPEDILVPLDHSGSNFPIGGYQERLAYGMRLPFLIISPFTKKTLSITLSMIKHLFYASSRIIGNLDE